MLTQNWINAVGMLLQRCAIDKGMLPIKAHNGTTYYLTPSSAIPVSVTHTLATSSNAVGLCIGSGNTPATVNDYQLETPINSGLTANSIVITPGFDENNNPCLTFDLTLTNTTSASITINEIGNRQNLKGATEQNGTSSSNRVCLLDRTVFETPVVIAAGGMAAIRYVLKTMIGQAS